MYIKCWGSRGSIPVSGKKYFKYGGDTTCIEIRTKSDDIIIIDAGTGIRRLGTQLMKENRTHYHFLFTHAHWDHVMGFPYFKPLYSKDVVLEVHKCAFHNDFVEKILTNVMTPPNFPVNYADIKAKINYIEAHTKEFEIGSVKVVPIPISHPGSGSGFKFVEDGKIFVFLTDNELGFIHQGGLPYQEYRDFAYKADLLFHDAEYTPKEYETSIDWGHSTYTDVLNLAFDAKVKKLGLFHLNQERTDQQMDRIVESCKKIIDKEGRKLKCFAVKSDMTFKL